MGRPTKLDEVTAQRIVNAIRVGAPWTIACRAAGIDKATAMRWKARGRAGEAPYRDFCDRVRVAEAECLLGHLEVVQEAANKGDLRASQWFIERRAAHWFAPRKPEAQADAPMTEEEARKVLEEAAEWVKKETG